jgi:hypothetical protein
MARMTKSLILEVPHTEVYAIAKTLESKIQPHIRDLTGDKASQVLEDMPNQKIVSKATAAGVSVTTSDSFRPIGEDKTEVVLDIETGLVAGKTAASLQMAASVTMYKAIEAGFQAGQRLGKHEQLKNCKKCGKELNPEFTVCPFCGEKR